MNEEEEYKKNFPLIYLAIKELKIHWFTEDEHQEYIDAGTDGLLNGIRTYDESKGFKKSTYYFSCIKHEMYKKTKSRTALKRQIKTVSLSQIVGEDTELEEFIPSDEDIENEVLKKVRNEELLKLVNMIPNPKDRYVIKMLYGLDGFKETTQVEIAKRWGTHKSNITPRKNRALEFLWRKIKDSENRSDLFKD